MNTRELVKCWLNDHADEYIIITNDGKRGLLTHKKTMVTDLMKYLDQKEAEEPKISEMSYADIEKETEVTQRVRRVIEKLFYDNPVKITDRLYEDLDFDSLDEIELIMALEKEFDIRITDEEVILFRDSLGHSMTVEDVVDGVMKKLVLEDNQEKCVIKGVLKKITYKGKTIWEDTK